MSDTSHEIFLVRHGTTMLNAAARMQGWTDAPLTREGVRLAETLGRGFAEQGVEFDAVYTSDTGRATHSAELILESAKQPHVMETLIRDPRLREANFGSYEGMLGDEVTRLLAEAHSMTVAQYRAVYRVDEETSLRSLLDTLALWDSEGGVAEISWPAESFAAVQERGLAAMDSMVAENQGASNNILVVAHGVTISIILEALGAAEHLPNGGLRNASVNSLSYDGEHYRVNTVDDLSTVELGASVMMDEAASRP